ncbi:MAG: TetR/AcrR family transcriptional regulator [Bacteroidales bacterium]|jgi:AcrR family transcriptional regulator|nr:TetR/AcrR family transcriptional regulator [Bacteroidales bacterium]
MLTDRQKEIIEVSLNLIANKGIQGLTIKNISREIGISEPAIYRHYENKIQILIALLDQFRMTSGKLFREVSELSVGPVEKIDQLFKRHFQVFSENTSWVAVIFAEEIFRNEPILMNKIGDIVNQNDILFQLILKEGQETGEIRNDVRVEHLSIIAMGALRLFVKKWQYSLYDFNLINEGTHFLNSIKQVITAK